MSVRVSAKEAKGHVYIIIRWTLLGSSRVGCLFAGSGTGRVRTACAAAIAKRRKQRLVQEG